MSSKSQPNKGSAPSVLSKVAKGKKMAEDPAPTRDGKKQKRVEPAETSTKKKPSGDARFASFTTDPRFRSASFKEGGAGRKVAVDKRFKAMFEDDEFQASKSKVDKYGRKVSKKDDTFGDMSRHYTLTEEEETRLEELNKIARGEVSGESSSSEEETDESDVEADELEDDEEKGASHLLPAEMGMDSSRRLAVVGCDWDHIRAVDILAVLRSFVPATGAVLDVAVYSSEFGRKRIAEEEAEGPFAQMKRDDEDGQEESDEEEGENGITDAGAGYDPELLRKYEKERMLYYFAVVSCDSVDTAETIYRECDGLEFERSSVGLDLRFIPDDTIFDKSTLRDRAGDIPESYAPIDFVNKSVQQTRVQLTWDDPEHDRRKLSEWGTALATKKKDPKSKGVPLDELEAFIASEDEIEDSDEEDEKRQQDVERYRNLLLRSSKTKKASEEDEEEEVGGEDFFVDDDEEETKEKAAKEQKQSYSKKEGKGRKEEEPQEVLRAPKKKSSLFLEEDQLGLGGEKKAGKKKVSKKEKVQAKLADDEEDVNVDMDVKDERFTSLFTEPEYAFDRTDPRFKSTETTRKIEEERRRRMGQRQ